MALSAMLDAGLDLETVRNSLSLLNLDGWSIEPEKVKRHSITATYADIKTEEHHHHRGLTKIREIIEESGLPDDVKRNAVTIFTTLGEAEAAVHDIDIEQVHFHEVGALDSIIDIVGFCIGIDELGIDDIYCAPIALGGGSVECAHGILPVPAPATTRLLEGIPCYGGPVDEELTTPTGAALMKSMAKSFGPMPPLTVKANGFGTGKKILDPPNLLHLIIGETSDLMGVQETLSIIETNIDDMSPEDIAWLTEKLFSEGCRECFITPVQMKKNRPGVLLSAICLPNDTSRIIEILLTQSSTRGVRFRNEQRVRFDERVIEKQTRYGPVHFKESILDGKVIKTKPEYEDLKRIAEENGIPIHEVRRDVLKDE